MPFDDLWASLLLASLPLHPASLLVRVPAAKSSLPVLSSCALRPRSNLPLRLASSPPSGSFHPASSQHLPSTRAHAPPRVVSGALAEHIPNCIPGRKQGRGPFASNPNHREGANLLLVRVGGIYGALVCRLRRIGRHGQGTVPGRNAADASRPGVLSRHTVTHDVHQALTKGQPVTKVVTTRHRTRHKSGFAPPSRMAHAFYLTPRDPAKPTRQRQSNNLFTSAAQQFVPFLRRPGWRCRADRPVNCQPNNLFRCPAAPRHSQRPSLEKGAAQINTKSARWPGRFC